MINRKLFFDLYKRNLDKDNKLTQKEVDALYLFIAMVDQVYYYFTLPQWAYVFATTFHETAFTFEPVKEAFHLSENWRQRNLRYFPYYGRGYVQITWLTNYEKFSELMQEDLTTNPDVVLDPEYAFKIMIYGMKHGTFTGKSIGDYVNDTKTDYKGARRVINGTDKASTIDAYAREFEYILKKVIT
tara:strand:- start:2481 stop:3038 length:558 start_codon:yes stop_codon:yes gene_type:complete